MYNLIAVLTEDMSMPIPISLVMPTHAESNGCPCPWPCPALLFIIIMLLHMVGLRLEEMSKSSQKLTQASLPMEAVG